MKLFMVKFCTAMSHQEEDCIYVVKSETLPSDEDIIEALHTVMYSGTIWLDAVTEIIEKDIRFKKNRVVGLKKWK